MNEQDLIPPIGSVSQAERMFRVNWVASLLRSPSGVPLHRADFVSRQGRSVRIVDVRTPEELTGALGYVPGSDYVARENAIEVLTRLDRDAPLIIVSRGGERAAELAHELERRGQRFVAAMMGGIVAWRDLGFVTTRDPEVLERAGRLREIVAAAPREGALSREEVAQHVGDVNSVRWMKLAALLVNGRVSCVDGRDDSGVIGTPGGDGGEFLLALVALERITGRALDDKTIDALLMRHVDAFGRFYMHTDVHAANLLIKSLRSDRRFDAALANVSETLEWRKFLTHPPSELHDALLEHTMRPDHLGCGHIRLMRTRPHDYGVRAELVSDFLRAFLLRRWKGMPELEMAPLPGGHAEGAVLNIRSAHGVFGFSKIPLISPSVGAAQAFINHPDVTAFLRGQLAQWLALQGDLVQLPAGGVAALAAEIERLAGVQLGHTLGALAKGLPIYDVIFGDGSIDVRAVGSVSSAA
jgi:rhodanese-related sulfurtransferase